MIGSQRIGNLYIATPHVCILIITTGNNLTILTKYKRSLILETPCAVSVSLDNELQLFPKSLENPIRVLILNFGDNEERYALAALQEIRKASIVAEIFPDKAKIGKQMTFANNKGIPFVVMAGEDEMKDNLFTLKNMETGEQEKLAIGKIIERIQ